MRKAIASLAGFLFAACALAQSPIGGITAPGTRTYTSKQTLGSGCGQSAIPFFSHAWLAASFTTSGAYTITRADLGLEIQAASPFSAAVTGYVYSDSGGSGPSTLLQTASPTETYTLTNSVVYYPWYFSGQSLSASTRYWIAIHGTVDTTNQPLWCGSTGGSETFYYSDNGTSWTMQNTGQLRINTYSSP
jgi:hypothetical protein